VNGSASDPGFVPVLSRTPPASSKAAPDGDCNRISSETQIQSHSLSRVVSANRKADRESRGEVELSASILQYYADNAETFLAPRPINSIAGEAHIEYSPLGVLIGVQPWNYPYYQLARFAAPHLVSGNVMLVKHASGVPQCALAFEQLLAEAGAPAGAYTNVFLSNDQVAKLIDDPRTKGVALTGSEPAGSLSLLERARI
jgi:acyl-CoA reductase-like NAD-dependent aldehyde dehydrogenase